MGSMSETQVWKFQLATTRDQFEMPVGAKVIHVGLQDDTICVWAVVRTGAATATRRFVVAGTGWQIPDRAEHLGTVLAANGTVWHVFEVTDDH